MLNRFCVHCMARLLALTVALTGMPLLAQQELGSHRMATAPVAVASEAPASKPLARRPRPQLGTGVAFAPDGALWMVGLTAQGQLFVQSAAPTAGPAGAQWAAPRVLDTAGDPISADGENHPKLVFGPNAMVLIAYTQPLPKSNTGYVRMLRSRDGGQTFSLPFTVHTDRQEITHRFESIGFDAKGALHSIWIDKRDLEAAPKVGNKSSYRGAAIYRNVSTDGGASFGPDIKVADHSCECCRIALGLGADGILRAMWRHVFEPNVRDHAFAALTTVVTLTAPTIVRATYDDWRVDGCPHHGPSLAASAEGFHAVWFGIRQHGVDPGPGVRYARLKADGSPLEGTVQRLPDDRAEHASVAAHGSRVAVVWRSVEGTTSTLKAWLSSDGGQTFRVRTLAQANGDNDFARLVQQGERITVVWRQTKEVQVYELAF